MILDLQLRISGKLHGNSKTIQERIKSKTKFRTSKSYRSSDEATALSRFFLPTKHQGQTVSALTSIRMSFFPLLLVIEAMKFDLITIKNKTNAVTS